jgi:hypothetical protein
MLCYAVKKLNGENLIKIIEEFRSVIININFFFLIYYFIYLLIFIMINVNPLITLIIYYDKFLPFNL